MTQWHMVRHVTNSIHGLAYLDPPIGLSSSSQMVWLLQAQRASISAMDFGSGKPASSLFLPCMYRLQAQATVRVLLEAVIMKCPSTSKAENTPCQSSHLSIQLLLAVWQVAPVMLQAVNVMDVSVCGFMEFEPAGMLWFSCCKQVLQLVASQWHLPRRQNSCATSLTVGGGMFGLQACKAAHSSRWCSCQASR